MVKWKRRKGRRARQAGEKTAGKGGGGGEMHLICSPSPCCVGFSRMGYAPSIFLSLKDLPLYTEQ